MNARRWTTLLLVPFLLAAVAGCGGSDTAETKTDKGTETASGEAKKEATKVKIAIPNINSAFVNVLVAKHGGLFEKNGLDVELVTMASPTIAPALVKGDVDMTAGIGSASNAARAGLPITIVAATMGGADYTLVVDESIKSPEDLKGQTVVTGPATSTPGVMANAILDQLGVLKDVKIANIDETSTRITQLASGRVKAGLVNLDGALRLTSKNPNLKLLATPEDFPPLPFTGVATTNDYLQKNAEVVKSAIRASLEAGVMLRDDPEGSAKLLATALEVEPDLAKQVQELMAKQVIIDGTPDETQISSDAKLASLASKKTVTEDDLKAHYDFSIVEGVAKELGLSG